MPDDAAKHEAEEPLQVLCREENLTPKYATFVAANHNRHNFLLDFAQHLPTDGPFKAEIVARIAVPPTVIDGLIKVLSEQRAKYADKFGESPFIVDSSHGEDGGGRE
ncbi:MAG: DUF3467 domain-containing protein [Bacillota bacterium]|jgi:hypothetical protein